MRLVGLDGNIVSQPVDIETTTGVDLGSVSELTQADDGATAGPTFTLTRTSSSPAADDLLGSILFRGNDSAGNVDTYSSITGRIGRTNSTSERGLINFNAINNGADEIVMTMSRNGLFMGAGNKLALGGDSANFFTSLYVVDPTADRTITFPDADGTVQLQSEDYPSPYFTTTATLATTDNSADAGPVFSLSRNSASPANSDILGQIAFRGLTDPYADILTTDSKFLGFTYSSIEGQIERITQGGERGRLRFNCMSDGSMETIATMNRNGLFFGPNNKIAFAGTTDNNNFITLLAATDPTGFRTIGLPDSDGTVCLTTLQDNIDVNGKKLVSSSNGDIELEPNGTGKIILDGSIDIEGDRSNSNSLFINNDMSSDLTDDLHNTIECQSDYRGGTIGSNTRQQSITFSFRDDAVNRQAGRFSSEFTSTDPSANKMKLIAIDHAGSPSNGQIDVSPKVASVNVPFELPSYTVANLPTAGIGAGAMAFCTNDAGGAVPCFYDGSAWRRVTDRAVAST
jgi:hypothetical protein